MEKTVKVSLDWAEKIKCLLDDYAKSLVELDDRGNHIYVQNCAKVLQEYIDNEK